MLIIVAQAVSQKMIVSSELYHKSKGKLYSCGMSLDILSDRKLRITQVEQKHFLDLPASDVWSSDKVSAAVLEQNFQKWQL